MPTKIQIPTSGNANTAHLKAGGQCFWDANGQNSYSISLPPNSFVEFPMGGIINANNGGSSQTVTLMQLTPGTTVHCSFTKTNAAASASGGSTMTAAATAQSGQSDIIIDP